MLDLIHLHDECDADRDLAVRVVQMEDTDLLYLYYSNDNGFTFYNTDAPREAIRNPRRGLKATHEDLHDLHNEALRRLDCDDEVPRKGVPECSTTCSFCGKKVVRDGFGECDPKNTDKDGVGRTCCKDAGQDGKICYLNDGDKGNTCKCGSEEVKACYIDMRCPETQTWQKTSFFYPAKCRVKPDGKCCIDKGTNWVSEGCAPWTRFFSYGRYCTDGYECVFKEGFSNSYSDARYCVSKEK